MELDQPRKFGPLISIYIELFDLELHAECAFFDSVWGGGLAHLGGVEEESEDFGDEVDFPGDE